MATGGVLIGSPSPGFLSRVTDLEKEVNFLKEKVEEDARWKVLLEKWILDNFAFDVRGTLLAKETAAKGGMGEGTFLGTRGRETRRDASIPHTHGGGQKNPINRGGSSTTSASKASREERRLGHVITRSSTQQFKRCPSELDQLDAEDEEGERGGGDFYDDLDDQVEVNVEPHDLFIRPDCPLGEAGSDGDDGEHQQGLKNSLSESDYDGDEALGEMGDSSSEEEKRQRKKVNWTVHSSYPDMESLKQNFNMREWALMSTTKTTGGTKMYYYCKMCRKAGPGRIMLNFQSEETKVEFYTNNLGHDHSKKILNRMTEETSSLILNLYKEGMKKSTQIINSLKISKPDLRLPSQKQVCYVLKAQKRKERKEKKLLDGKRVKGSKLENMSRKAVVTLKSQSQREGDAKVGSGVDMSSSHNFESPQPQIVSVSGGYNAPGPPLVVGPSPTSIQSTNLLQPYTAPPVSVYQHSNPSYDINTNAAIHLQHQQHFHSL